MAALDDLAFNLDLSRRYNAKRNSPSLGVNPGSFQMTLGVPTVALGKTAANTAAGGADLLAVLFTTVGAGTGTTVTLDLTALADVSGVVTPLVRVKYLEFWLLAAADKVGTGAAQVAGTACSAVRVGPGGTNGFLGWWDSATSRAKLENGESVHYTSRTAGGKAVDATHKTIDLYNYDAAVAAKVMTFVVGGSG
jgi:hypothetical protein